MTGRIEPSTPRSPAASAWIPSGPAISSRSPIHRHWRRPAACFTLPRGSDEGPYTIWFDDIRYTFVGNFISNVRPSITTEAREVAVGELFTVSSASVTVNAGGEDMTLDPISPAYFSFTPTTTRIASSFGLGKILGRSEGATEISGLPAGRFGHRHVDSERRRHGTGGDRPLLPERIL